MNTPSVLVLAAVLALPGAVAAAPAADAAAGGPWSVGVGLAVPAFAAGGGDAVLPTYLVLSTPFRHAGLRVEPELGVGSGRSHVARTIEDDVVIGGDPFTMQLPVSQRAYRLGVTVAPEWVVASGATLYAGARLAGILRRVAYDAAGPEWQDSFDYQLDAAAGGELALSPAVAVGAALRFGWTVLGAAGGGDLAPADETGFFAGEALVSARIGW